MTPAACCWNCRSLRDCYARLGLEPGPSIVRPAPASPRRRIVGRAISVSAVLGGIAALGGPLLMLARMLP